MGALIVVGDGPEVLNICSGGFLLDAAFSPPGPRISASWEKIERVGACTMGWNAKA